MALVKIDLTPYLMDNLWNALDRVTRKRLKHIDLPWDELASCLDYTIEVSYYEEEIADAKEELE